MPVKRTDFQERHHDYVLGPNQDSRLASIAPGAIVKKVKLVLDPDAPFALRGRATRIAYDSDLTQIGLNGLATQWAGPALDYRMQTYIPERLQMANYGQVGNFGPIFPEIVYPASSVIQIDVFNGGAVTLTNLTFFWRGVKLFPWGAVPGYTYPKRMSALTFCYPIAQLNMGASEIRANQLFTVKQDADFVIRAGQATAPSGEARDTSTQIAEVSMILRDFNKKPYSNDYVPLDILFGSAAWPSTIPVGPTPSLVSPFGTGPAQPGLFYPEIYVPANHQMVYDIQRQDGAAGQQAHADSTINLIGSKVFPR